MEINDVFAIAKKGDVVFVEAKLQISCEMAIQLSEQLKAATEKTGVHIIVLPDFLKVAQVNMKQGKKRKDVGK